MDPGEGSDERLEVLFFFFLNRIVLTAVWRIDKMVAVTESGSMVSRQWLKTKQAA